MHGLTEHQCEDIAASKAACGECEGSCQLTHGGHRGQCLAVRVTAPDGYDWGWWSYCENAVAEDQDRKMLVVSRPNARHDRAERNL